MQIYLICPVRNVTPELQADIETYVQTLEEEGNHVHFPATRCRPERCHWYEYLLPASRRNDTGG